MDNPDIGMWVNQGNFTKSILQECDEWALKDGQTPPE